jgi:hypothetical protein
MDKAIELAGAIKAQAVLSGLENVKPANDARRVQPKT